MTLKFLKAISSECYFPKDLKASEILSLFKRLDAFIKNNYRPITVLSSVSKIYGKVLENQINHMPLVFLFKLRAFDCKAKCIWFQFKCIAVDS